MSDIQFSCPRCGHNLVVDESGAGLSVPCPECNEPLVIPSPEEGAAAQANNTDVAVDAVSAVKTDPGELPLDKPTAGDQAPKRSSAVRGVARIFWMLFKWLAMAACLIGWLINVTVRWIVALPMLKSRLARQYKKMGAQAYRNKIDEEMGSDVRNQLRAIDRDAEATGVSPVEGQNSKSRLSLFMERRKRRRRMIRLYAMLGNELAEGEATSDTLSRQVQRAAKTAKTIERIKATWPKIASVANFTLGMVLVGMAAAAYYYRSDIAELSFGRPATICGASQVSSIPIPTQGEAISDVTTVDAPSVMNAPEMIEYSDSDILSGSELERIERSVGNRHVFYVRQRADYDAFPPLRRYGDNVWEIIIYYASDDPGFLVTDTDTFKREGEARMWIREIMRIPVEDKKGFKRDLIVYEQSPEEDVRRYERHLAAVSKQQAAVDDAKRKQKEADAGAQEESDTALEKAQKEELAKAALADAVEYAQQVIPAAVRLPEIHLSEKLKAKGFTAKLHMARHEDLYKCAEKKDWPGVVRMVSGRIESRKDVDLAVRRLAGSERPGGWEYKKEWVLEGWGDINEVVLGDSHWRDPERSWDVYIEVSSSTFTLDHRYIQLRGSPQLYIGALELPADPEKLVFIMSPWKPEKAAIFLHDTATTNPLDPWTELENDRGFMYKIPLGGNIIYFMEVPIYNKQGMNNLLEKGFEKMNSELRSLNLKKKIGDINIDELYSAAVNLAEDFYRYISEKVAPAY